MDLFDLHGLKRRATFYDDVKHLLGADKAPKPRNLSATVKQRLRTLAKSAAGSSATVKQRIRAAASGKNHR